MPINAKTLSTHKRSEDLLSKFPRLDATQALAVLSLSATLPFHKLMCGDRYEENAACYDGLVDEAAVTSEDAVSRQARS